MSTKKKSHISGSLCTSGFLAHTQGNNHSLHHIRAPLSKSKRPRPLPSKSLHLTFRHCPGHVLLVLAHLILWLLL